MPRILDFAPSSEQATSVDVISRLELPLRRFRVRNRQRCDFFKLSCHPDRESARVRIVADFTFKSEFRLRRIETSLSTSDLSPEDGGHARIEGRIALLQHEFDVCAEG